MHFIKFPILTPEILSQLTGNDLKALIAICKYLPNAFPSFHRLSQDTGLPRANFTRHISKLESLGVLIAEKRKGRSNLYKVSSLVQTVPPPTVVICEYNCRQPCRHTVVTGADVTRRSNLEELTNSNFFEFLNKEIQEISGNECSLIDFKPNQVFLDICSNKFSPSFKAFVKREANQARAAEDTKKGKAEYLFGQVDQYVKHLERWGT